MKKTVRMLFAVILAAALAFSLGSTCFADTPEETDSSRLSLWNPDGVITKLIAYVSDVTDPESENFIPEEDRVAVFDLDGTLVGEQAPIYFEWMLYCQRVLADPDYEATQEMKDLAKEILQAAVDKEIPESIEPEECVLYAQAFDGMDMDDYRQYVASFLEMEVDGFDNASYKDMYFRPMEQVLGYLEENDFTVFIVSGTDRDADRVMLDEFHHIPYYQVIGTDSQTEGDHHDEENYLDYNYDIDEQPMRDDELIIKNVKSSKVAQMVQEIGQKPVLAFGNSSGDTSMFTYVTQDNPYLSAAFCLVPDDDSREYANESKVEKLIEVCQTNGWNLVSMKNDFLTIYGDSITKNEDGMTYTESLMEKYVPESNEVR